MSTRLNQGSETDYKTTSPVRRATWFEPPVPTTPRRLPSRSILPPVLGLLVGIPFGLAILFGSNLLVWGLAPWLWVLADALVGAFCWLWWTTYVDNSSRQIWNSTQDIPGFVDGTRSYGVELDVRYDRAIVGTDRGRIWFDHDALCFAGERTSFALTSDLIRFDEVRLTAAYADFVERQCEIPLESVPGKGNWSIQFDFHATGPSRTEEFRKFLAQLKAAEPNVSIRQLPPLTKGPGADADLVAWLPLQMLNGLIRVIAAFVFSVWCLSLVNAIAWTVIVPIAVLIVWAWRPSQDLIRAVNVFQDLRGMDRRWREVWR